MTSRPAAEASLLHEGTSDDIRVRSGEALMAIIAVWAAMVVLSGGVAPLVGRWLNNPFWLKYIETLAEKGFIVVMLYYLFSIRHDEGLAEGLHLRFAPIGWTVGAAVAGVGYFVATRLLLSSGARSAGLNPVEMIFFTVVALIVAFVGELFYRGLVYPLVRRVVSALAGRVIGVLAAVVVSAAWFGLQHYSTANWQEKMPEILVLVGLGFLATLARQFGRSLGPAVALNLGWSAALCVAMWLRMGGD